MADSTRRALRVAIALAALLALTHSPSWSDPADLSPFTLAILRQDGIIIPFASWTGKAWENPWPVPEKEVDTPITFGEIPRQWWSKAVGPLERWIVWQVDGTTTPVKVASPTWFPAHCLQGLGLRTTLPLRRPPPPQRVQPYPKVGIAMSRQLDLAPIEALDPSGPAGQGLLKSIASLMAEDEERVDFTYLTSLKAERRKFPVKIEALYRSPTGRPGVFAYYFEAVRRYPPIDKQAAPPAPKPGAPPPPEPCEVVTVMIGSTIARDADPSMTPDRHLTRMTSCDFDTVDVMLPLASLNFNGQTAWIAQLSGWGRERYVLVDPEAPVEQSIVWNVPGGTCLKPGGQ